MINPNKILNAKTISLSEIGWSESRTDEQISKYIKKFVFDNYGLKIDDDTEQVIFHIVDDLLCATKYEGVNVND